MTDTTPKIEENKVPVPGIPDPVIVPNVVPVPVVPSIPSPVVTPPSMTITPTETPKLNVFGRPREYDPAYHLTQIRLYLDNPNTSVTVRDLSVQTTKGFDMYKVIRIPTVAGLASFLKIHRATIYRWAETFPDFCDMLEELQTQQEQILIENGLTGGFNSVITKLMLGKHGYKEGIEHSGPEGGALKVDVTSQLAKVYGTKPERDDDQMPDNG